MASSDNLASIEPWAFRSPFPDSWISEAFARDTETLTKALQKSLSDNTTTETLTSDSISPFLHLKPETASPTPTVSNVSGSDPETAPKRQRNAIPGSGSGKVSKRKSRAAKRSQTTFITADPANFRQMVQQVTGIRFGNSQMSMAPILKPEPQRLGNRLPGGVGGGCLPTLDTSAFLLDHHQQNVMVGPTTTTTAAAAAISSGPVTGSLIGSGPLSFQSSVVADNTGVGFDFDTFASFPTLESWKVM